MTKQSSPLASFSDRFLLSERDRSLHVPGLQGHSLEGQPVWSSLLLNAIRQDSLRVLPGLLKRIHRQSFFFITNISHKNKIERLD